MVLGSSLAVWKALSFWDALDQSGCEEWLLFTIDFKIPEVQERCGGVLEGPQPGAFEPLFSIVSVPYLSRSYRCSPVDTFTCVTIS